ncbi:MAG TPA: citramalate synthase [Chthoniobacteraceae bacterium]|jgi:2-isopropylmalate synthase
MNTPRVTIYDTTLRDGTQGTGISFSVLDKIRVAEKLDQFGVHYIEGGWPGSNPKDIAFFQEAAKRTWLNAKVTAFGMTRRANLAVEQDSQVQLLLDAQTPAVTIVGKTWKLQVTEIFNTTPEENLLMIADTIRHLKSHGREVLYDAEHFFDGADDDWAYAMQTLEAARDAGADLIVLCETNGGTLPDKVERMTRDAIKHLGVPVGIHTHNDCELGVANALAAVRAGAVQVQGTINGYGERVGNCNLISVMANLQLKMGLEVVPDLTRLRELSLFVDELANVPHHIRAPYVGAAAFTHKGGLHVHAVQKLSRAYEHVPPATVGNHQTIVISDMSGQSNVIVKAEQLGFKFRKGAPEVARVLTEVKRLENEGYEFEAAEGSFELLIRRQLGSTHPLFELHEYHCTFRRAAEAHWNKCEATVKLSVEGVHEYTVAEGDGPVNALDAALRKALRPFYPRIDDIILEDFKVRIINGQQGTGARTRVLIGSTDGHESWGTVGVSDNIIEASWLALVDSFEYKLGKVAETPAAEAELVSVAS